MPLYEYKCEECGQVIEILQASTAHLAENYCPNCQAVKPVAKLFSLTASPQGSGSDGFASTSTGGGGGCGCGRGFG
ncbi:MAG: zinc ribbon domain-containing protein [bacterium]|nr:zinc ribbon domain-containing protein [bacterium]